MLAARPRIALPFAAAAGLGLVLGAAGCDRTYDFTCTAIWMKGDKQISKDVYTYEKLSDETQATERCKKAMLEKQPKGAAQASCKCEGK